MGEEAPAVAEEVPEDVPTAAEAEDSKKILKKVKKVLAFYGYAVYNRSRCDVDSVEA